MSGMQGLTIAIVYSYESTTQLRRCVDSLVCEIPDILPLVGQVHWQLIKTPKAADKDTHFFPGSVLDSKSENLGANRNLALHAAKTEGFYFIDPDCWIERGSLKTLCKAYIQNRNDKAIFGFAGPNILISKNRKLERAFRWLGKLRFLNGGLSQISVQSKDRLDWHSPTCHILYNLKHLEDAAFSSRFVSVGEDLEFHFRQSRNKRRILICSQSRVWHEQSEELLGYLKKSFVYGKAQTLLLKAQPKSIGNKRLLLPGAVLAWIAVFFLLNGAGQWLFVMLSLLSLFLILGFEIIFYEDEKDFFSFPSFFILVATSYLLGQFSGLLVPLPARKNEEPKRAKNEYF